MSSKKKVVEYDHVYGGKPRTSYVNASNRVYGGDGRDDASLPARTGKSNTPEQYDKLNIDTRNSDSSLQMTSRHSGSRDTEKLTEDIDGSVKNLSGHGGVRPAPRNLHDVDSLDQRDNILVPRIYDNEGKTRGEYDQLNQTRSECPSQRTSHYSEIHGTLPTEHSQQQGLEMGVKNMGYQNYDHPSSTRTLHDIHSPEQHDNIPIIRPPSGIRSPSPGIRSPSPGIEVRGSILNETRKPTYSEYSSISDVMSPYVLPNGPSTATHTKKKLNVIYDNSSETVKSFPSDRKNGNCEYCKLVVVTFIGLVALVAILMVFLLMFGVISTKQCVECHDNNILLREMQEELKAQRELVKGLTTELEEQKKLTNALNVSVYNVSCMKGETGPPGLNGTDGPPGPSTNFNSSNCELKTVHTEGQRIVKVWEVKYKDKYNINYSCGFNASSGKASGVKMLEFIQPSGSRDYICECRGIDQAEIRCYIQYWSCHYT